MFDTEGVGFIKVTMLKRFLVQAQLEVDESVCKYCSAIPASWSMLTVVAVLSEVAVLSDWLLVYQNL